MNNIKKQNRIIASFLVCCLVMSLKIFNTSTIEVKANVKNSEVTISSEKMDVLIDKDFPRVIQYNMKSGDLSGKFFYGQTEKLTHMLINDLAVKPDVETKVYNDKAVYKMTFKDYSSDGTKIVDTVITAQLSVKDNILEFNITDIIDNKIVKTIEIPNHNLISVKSNQKGAILNASNLSTNTHINGDRALNIDENLDIKAEAKKGYAYAILSTNELSASLWTNTENNLVSKLESDTMAAKRDAQRITATASKDSEEIYNLGLSSTFWTYQKGELYRKENGVLEFEDGTTKQVDEMPWAKVIITGDENEDSTINWQDGAIAIRNIINTPLGSEKVPDLAAYRISMNFGGQAQNPFLMTLDGVKKVYLNTDGLGQSILLKGYGSEGHDSGHLNYADIGTRIGGAEDMKTLLSKGKEFGATFGIHINASETYPESIYFEEDRLLRDPKGTYKYGWNWIDQGINISADYDLRSGRAERFKDLYNVLGADKNDLDFIYVDVWGNAQSGDNSTWPSRQLTKEITSFGWRVGSEWGYANEYDSTFQHWATDLTYGGYTLKGINSTIIRFIRNHQKDAWIGNYPSYGGEADAPLLSTYSMKDFEGWQGRSDYKAYINNLFAVNLPAKFSQHYKLMQWEDGNAVKMTDNKETYDWTPGMKAVLQDDTKQNTLVVTRNSNDYENNIDEYRNRTMTFNKNVIFRGQPGNETYLIPWFWDESGKQLSSENEKLYHWNTKGGETTWDVPDSWKGTVKVYELTELGKTNERNLDIKNGKITLKANPLTPYVILKKSSSNKNVKWSEGMHIIDSGFNSNSLANWKISGDRKSVTITKSEGNNNMLTIKDNKEKVELTQKVTDLKPNTKYAVYVGIDNRSEKNAGIKINNGNKEFSNSTGKSIAKNYVQAYAHNTRGDEDSKSDGKMNSTIGGTSYFQNMYVFFETTNDTSNINITLSKEAGNGVSYFDDIRFVENQSINQVSNTKFVQDFENVVQGIYPFVIGEIEGVTDNRTHLSEKHEPYTQKGWNQKEVSDVIGGKWSVKTNGLTEGNTLVYQTIPQNFKFESGKTYKVSFDYEAGSTGTYAVVIGNGPFEEKGVLTTMPLDSTANVEKDAPSGKYSFELVGDKSGQSWFGIYSTSLAPDNKQAQGAQATFNGYSDFILDNLVIETLQTK